MNYRFNLAMEKAIVSWIKNVTSLRVIAEQQKHASPRPTNDFCSYLLGAPRKIGQDDLIQKADDVFTHYGTRIFDLSMTIYAHNALEKASDLQNSLEMETLLSTLHNAGVCPLGASEILDTSAVLETGFEHRATLDFDFSTRIAYDETTYYIGIVKDIDGHFITYNNDDYGKVFTVQLP